MIRGAQKLYWRPSRIPGRALFSAVSGSDCSPGGLLNRSLRQESSAQYDQMLSASRMMEEGIEILRPLRGRVSCHQPRAGPASVRDDWSGLVDHHDQLR